MFRIRRGDTGTTRPLGNGSLVVIAAAVALTPALAGCGVGVNAQTTRIVDTTDGASTVVHDIAIRDVFVLGPPLGGTLAPGQSASLFLALINQGGPDRLLAASAPGVATSVQLPGRSISLGTHQAVLLTGPEPQVILTGLRRPLTGGEGIQLLLDFQNAGAVTLSVPVMPQAQYYATFSPPPSPTTPGSARPSTGSSAKPGRGTTATPAATPATTTTP